LFGRGLDLLALGFQCAVARHVQEGLRVLAALQLRQHAGEIAAQQVDVEHDGLSSGVVTCRRRHRGAVFKGV
jgi:alkyl hydroperoxide reductase subunit AhpC